MCDPIKKAANYLGDHVFTPIHKAVGEVKDFAKDPLGADAAAKKAKEEAEKAKAEAEAKEAARKAAIAQGQANIDNAFGQFNDGYFDNFKKTYTDNYTPQIEDQYRNSIGRLTAALAGRGQLGGTEGNAAFKNVTQRYGDENAKVANEAANQAASMRSTIENQKTDLYTLNQAAADPEGINARARAEATSLVAPPQYSQLGQVFADLVNPYLAYRNSQQAQVPAGKQYTPSYYNSTGSGRVVN